MSALPVEPIPEDPAALSVVDGQEDDPIAAYVARLVESAPPFSGEVRAELIMIIG